VAEASHVSMRPFLPFGSGHYPSVSASPLGSRFLWRFAVFVALVVAIAYEPKITNGVLYNLLFI
jgi:hypothetical protein